MKPASRKLFVNVSVRDLAASVAFFQRLGFAFNPQFTDVHAACLIVNPEASFMLVTEPVFRGFTSREISDRRTHSESLFAVSCGSREDVDAMFETAITAGGAAAMPSEDHGFMYSRSFYDLDGHHWEVLWMDTSGVPAQP